MVGFYSRYRRRQATTVDRQSLLAIRLGVHWVAVWQKAGFRVWIALLQGEASRCQPGSWEDRIKTLKKIDLAALSVRKQGSSWKLVDEDESLAYGSQSREVNERSQR